LLDVADDDLLAGKKLRNLLLTLFGADHQHDVGPDLQQRFRYVSSDAFFVGDTKNNHSLIREA